MPLNIPDYYQNPSELHIGCEEPRAYFIPFQSASAAEKAANKVKPISAEAFAEEFAEDDENLPDLEVELILPEEPELA